MHAQHLQVSGVASSQMLEIAKSHDEPTGISNGNGMASLKPSGNCVDLLTMITLKGCSLAPMAE